MKKLLTALTAAAIGFGGLAAAEASAQYSTTTKVERHHVSRNYHKKRPHRVCKTQWRHHKKVRRCRTVWR